MDTEKNQSIKTSKIDAIISFKKGLELFGKNWQFPLVILFIYIIEQYAIQLFSKENLFKYILLQLIGFIILLQPLASSAVAYFKSLIEEKHKSYNEFFHNYHKNCMHGLAITLITLISMAPIFIIAYFFYKPNLDFSINEYLRLVFELIASPNISFIALVLFLISFTTLNIYIYFTDLLNISNTKSTIIENIKKSHKITTPFFNPILRTFIIAFALLIVSSLFSTFLSMAFAIIGGVLPMIESYLQWLLNIFNTGVTFIILFSFLASKAIVYNEIFNNNKALISKIDTLGS